MSDQNAQADQAQNPNAPVFNMQRVYLKDLSLEMPNAPNIFLEQEGPKVEVTINVGGQALAETVFESTITVTVTTKIGDKVLYLVEATQGGVFEIANVPLMPSHAPRCHHCTWPKSTFRRSLNSGWQKQHKPPQHQTAATQV
jgi:protein-export chaperone SecB